MAKNWKVASLEIAQEAAQSQQGALGGTNLLFAQEATINPNFEKIERDYLRSTLDPLPHAVGKVFCDVTAKGELKNGGTAGSEYTPFSYLLQACGFIPSGSAGSWTYTPTSAASSSAFFGPGKSVTLSLIRDGIKKVSNGVIGNIKFVLEPGKPGMWEFSGKGLYNAPTDATVLSVTSSNTSFAPRIVNCTLTISGSTTQVAGKIEIDPGIVVGEIEDWNGADGIGGFQQGSRKPKGSIEIVAPSIAATDFLTKCYNGTTFSVSATIGSVAGQRIQITLPAVQLDDVTDQAKGDFYYYQLPVSFAGTGSGDNWITLKLF